MSSEVQCVLPSHNNTIILNGTAESASRYWSKLGDEEQNAERNCVRIHDRSRRRVRLRAVRSAVSVDIPFGGEQRIIRCDLSSQATVTAAALRGISKRARQERDGLQVGLRAASAVPFSFPEA